MKKKTKAISGAILSLLCFVILSGCVKRTGESEFQEQPLAKEVPESTHPVTVYVIENRFIAKGRITDIKPDLKGIMLFSMEIIKTEKIGDYPNFGDRYINKTVEICSEIGIPSSLHVGQEVSVVLRVSGDEWKQSLFLVEVIKNENDL